MTAGRRSVAATGRRADICVIGRTNFDVGMGSISYAACELLSRFFSVSLYPIHSGEVTASHVVLPSGRRIPVAKDPAKAEAVFYTDVLWNGESDLNYTAVPDDVFRVAHLAYDSDLLPARWVDILNARFDVAYFTSKHLMEVATRSGVLIPVGWLPIGLDIANLLCALPVPPRPGVTFGSVASFHPRKGTDILVQAFLEEFGDSDEVRLLLHSNLGFGEFPDHIREMVALSGVRNIEISNVGRSRADVVSLLKSMDVFVNCSMGEGYSIGPREALALGKSLVLSGLGPHTDLAGTDGVVMIPPTVRRPARYPEIDGRIFGSQTAVSVSDTRIALRTAHDAEVAGGSPRRAIRERRLRAAEFSFERLAASYAAVISPDVLSYRRHQPASPYVLMPTEATRVARKRFGRHGAHLADRHRVVAPAFDAGVLTVLNSFMDSLVNSAARDHAPMVLPDWDGARVFGEQAGTVRYFRYGVEEQNLWCSIFEPPYGLSARQLNDRKFLYSHAEVEQPRTRPVCIGLSEEGPTRAIEGPEWPRLRRLYGRYWKHYVRLTPQRQAEVDELRRRAGGRVTVGVSVGSRIGGFGHPQSEAERVSQVARRWLSTHRPKVDVGETTLVLDSASSGLHDLLSRQFGDVVDLATVDPVDGDHAARRAWHEVRDVIVLAGCDVVLCVPGDAARTVSYIDPTVELLTVGP